MPNLSRRRMAVAAIPRGSRGFRFRAKAVPVLDEAVEDESEDEYFDIDDDTLSQYHQELRKSCL